MKSKTTLTLHIVILSLYFTLAAIGQSDSGVTNKLLGTWVLKYHILANGDTCRYNKIKITFNANHSFLEVVNGGKSIGKWRLRNDTITYYNCSDENKHDIICNHSEEFHISKDGVFIEKEGVCSEVQGMSYYSKEYYNENGNEIKQ